MKLQNMAFANAAAVTVAIAYVVCSIFVALFPIYSLKILGVLVHLVNIEKQTNIQVTLGGFIRGLVQLEFYTYLTSLLFTNLYNRFKISDTKMR